MSSDDYNRGFASGATYIFLYLFAAGAIWLILNYIVKLAWTGFDWFIWIFLVAVLWILSHKGLGEGIEQLYLKAEKKVYADSKKEEDSRP
jgi:hypothetical protein